MKHVIFGTGPVGMSIMEGLVAHGEEVRMVNRSGKADVPAGVELYPGDAMDVNFVKSATQGAEYVYQALNPAYEKWVELFPPLQNNVIEGAAAAGAKLLVMGNLYAYGNPNGQPMNENTPINPNSRKGQVRAQMATDLMAAHQAGKVQVALIRASDFFGPRVLDSGMGERVFPPAMNGKGVFILGDPDKRHSYSYMPDIGATFVAIATYIGAESDVYGKVWHVPSAETLTTRAFVEKVYAAYGQPPKISKAPVLVVRLMGLFNPVVREVIEMMYQFDVDFIIDGETTRRILDVQTTPLDVAIRETADWYKVKPLR